MVPLLGYALCNKYHIISVMYSWKLTYSQAVSMLRKHPQLSSSRFQYFLSLFFHSHLIPWARKAANTLALRAFTMQIIFKHKSRISIIKTDGRIQLPSTKEL